jgi:hypothetical protein
MTYETITYTDYNGVTKTRKFYFHINKAELIELETMTPGGVAKTLDEAAKAKDAVKLMKFFKEIISLAYGEKSEDGERFIKSKELSEAFMQTEAYNQLFTSLVTDANKASKFINGIFPKDLVEAALKEQRKEQRQLESAVTSEIKDSNLSES